MSKKHYYYKAVKRVRKLGGYNVTATVYELKGGKLVKLGVKKWQTSSSIGSKSEVYKFLFTSKKIKLAEYKKSNGVYKSSASVIIDEI